MSTAKRMRCERRGMTLLEAVIALLVLSTGVAAVFGMVGRISNANRSMAFQTASLDAFSEISAQIRDARCDIPEGQAMDDFNAALFDPGLALTNGQWVNAAIAGSTIQLVGDFTNRVPVIRIDYRVAEDNTQPGPVSLDIDVRVREITGDPDKDDPARESGYWIQVFPVKKLCTPRTDATYRGEYE
jgi:type II secretory pathway pseudopilin PulG